MASEIANEVFSSWRSFWTFERALTRLEDGHGFDPMKHRS